MTNYDYVSDEMKDENTVKTAESIHSYTIEEKTTATVNTLDDLVKRREEKEKKQEIKRLTNKIAERYMQLHGQERLNPTGRDRLGKNAQYYQDIHMGIGNNTLFNGDTDKQLELLRILASPESEVTGSERLIRDLAEFEYKIRKQT